VTGLRTYWRRVGGFTAVLVAFALMFAPVAEAAVCGREAPPAALQIVDDVTAAAEVAVAAPDAHGSASPSAGDDLGFCQHGHCHHAAPYLPTLVSDVVAHPAVSTPAVKLANQHPRSRAASRLERPPRV
jgi:hypothetical protein